MKKIVIIGAGISGLAAAKYLSPHCKVTILEKTSKTGGWLKTDTSSGFLFECGPHTFRFDPTLCDLKPIYPSPGKRFLYRNKKLRAFPFLQSALLKEWRIPYEEKEESIAQFATRRFSSAIAEDIFDPMTLGIYAGDINRLSMNASFPKIKEWERKYGSLTKALLSNLMHKRGPSFFSFRNGAQSLIKTLDQNVVLNSEVIALKYKDESIEVVTETKSYEADIVICALPYRAAAKLFNLPVIRHESLSVVHVGFHQAVLAKKGFGYLIPTKENQPVMGAIFDSCVFPQQNRTLQETRLTFMVRFGHDAKACVLDALKNHLHIEGAPDYMNVIEAREAIPQYELGHQKLVSSIEKHVKELSPRLHLLGNYLYGVSVNDCVAAAKELSEDLLQSFKAPINRCTCSTLC